MTYGPKAWRVTALICTRNEAENLPHVLPLIPDFVDEVLMIDGHSTDDTVAVAERLRPGIRVLQQPGTGKGRAIRFGVDEAIGDIVVTLDADGQTDPQEMRAFLDALVEGADFAKGSRLVHGRPSYMRIHRWIGNTILARTSNLLFGTQYTDICSGYNAFSKQAFLRISLTYDRFEMEQQMLVRAHRAGLRVAEVSHVDSGRINGVSNISSIRQGFLDWFVIIGERFR
jgi:glycosyltransferase involved in cell wall biosynthesis